jgi:extracellular elastinolytic metalloproteinase
MKLFRLSVTVAAVLCATSAYPQSASYRPPAARIYVAAPGSVLTPAATDPAAAVAQFLNARGIAVQASALVDITTVNALNNVSVVRFEERTGGLTIYGVYAKAAFNARGELIHLIENLVPAGPLGPGRASAAQALTAALREQYGNAVGTPAQVRIEGNTTVFERAPFFHASPKATRMAFVADDGSLRTGTLVETWSQRENLLHHTLVGGDGEVLGVELRTNSDSYNVFTVDPSVTPQQPVAGGTNWLGTGTQRTVNISGPNVRAYLDKDANNTADAGGDIVTDGDFLTGWNETAAPDSIGNKAVAVQNLFYLNNVMHDVLKSYGFTPAAGNFEVSDPVNAEAQDGSGTDNANFSTPADGSSPRMQMYLWSNANPDHEVVVSAFHYPGKGADFGPALNGTGITASLALPSVADGCSKLKSLAGKVAVIDRGNCSFKKKVANAQAAGAVAVIIANNDGDTVFVMGNDPQVRTSIVIPSVMVGQANGVAAKSQAGISALVRKSADLLMTDASLDSDVVFHEYGHGLTWRMIGGMSGPMSGAIGEGASDGVALLMNAGDAIGEYSSGVPTGIRREPYANYSRTYKDVTGAEVHDDGEVFAAIVYDLKDRFQRADVGVSQLFRYYVDGMNYIPSGPAFEDMRDGMLQSSADTAHDCLIWQSFAKFGVGVGAQGTVRGTSVRITESKTLPVGCTPQP